VHEGGTTSKPPPVLAGAPDGVLGAALAESLLRHMACTVSVLEPDGTIRLSIADDLLTLGYDELAGVKVRDMVHPSDVHIFDEMQAAVLEHPGAEVDAQLRLLHRSGHYEVVEGTARNLLHDPDVAGVLITSRNVSRRHRHDRLLADANAALEAIAAGGSLDEVTRLVHALLDHQDPTATRMPTEPEALFEALEGDDSPAGAQARWILTLALSSHRVTTELRARATIDPLTGLLNRTGFTEALEEHLATSDRPAAVLLFDLDRFKQVNDAYGHSVGDAVLVSVAEALGRTVRTGDVAARFGGDEFAVLCSQLDGEDVELDARRLAQRLAVALASAPGPVRAGPRAAASIGVSVDRAGGIRRRDAESWIADADHAMYEAKRRGRGCVVVADHDTRRRAGHRLRVETGLREALDAGGLEVWFQPVVELARRCPVGSEALLRWRTPDGEVHTPGEFLQVAEDSGLMAAISLRTLGDALHEAARWGSPDESGLLFVAVNLSVTQLLADDLLDVLDGDLERSGIEPSRVVVELTEHVLAADEQLVARRLRDLRGRGVRLALDDFGTGWSSLRLVRTMPFDIIKVDGTFTEDVDHSAESYDFASRIVDLARSMGRTVVAEGIERETQCAALTEMGCDYGQGWLFGAPVRPAGP